MQLSRKLGVRRQGSEEGAEDTLGEVPGVGSHPCLLSTISAPPCLPLALCSIQYPLWVQ